MGFLLVAGQVQYFVEWSVSPGKFEEFKAIVQETVDAAKAKSRIVSYQWYFDEAESKCILFE